MNAKISNPSEAAPLLFESERWIKTADIAAVLIAAALPWSTSLVAIFAVAWLIVVVPTIKIDDFLNHLKSSVCALPIALVTLAIVGMLWSEAPWHAKFYALSPTAKLLVLPLLIYHFRRSGRGMWIFTAFLVSCALLMVMSWVVAFEPRLALKSDAEYGIPVKNYIDQSQEFALCAVAVAWPILQCVRTRRYGLVLLYATIAAAFLINMMYVTVSRTALVSMPVMLFVFALLHLNRRGIISVLITAAILSGALWFVAPNLRVRTMAAISEYHQYRDKNAASSVGLRLEFWRKSVEFFMTAPVVGHGTGSTHKLFAQAAIGQSGASAEIISNPHNQTLNVAVQWGTVGVIILYAMWVSHFLLFRGSGFYAWLGMLVVVQNVVSSVFNSHLFDFHEGWMYVLGVGVSGGMVLRGAAREAFESDISVGTPGSKDLDRSS